MLIYIVNRNMEANQVTVKVKFPLLPRVLKTYLHERLTVSKTNRVDITGYPAMRGYMLEMELFKEDLNHLDVQIICQCLLF